MTWSCEPPREGTMPLAGRGNSLLDCPIGFHPNPHPHTALTPASTPGGSDVAVCVGVSCDGETTINSWRWAWCPRRLGDRQKQRLKELLGGEWEQAGQGLAGAWGEDTWSGPSPSGMGVNRAGGAVLPSTSTCPLNTVPAMDCLQRMGAFNTDPERMWVPGTMPTQHR